jgi:hypothetical protein
MWSGNQISTSISSRILIQTDSDGCPSAAHPFPMSTFILQKLAPLWVHGNHEWAQILGRGPDDRELQWASPSMSFPVSQKLSHALKYLRSLLSSKDTNDWRNLRTQISGQVAVDLSIAPRWRLIMEPDWGNLPDRPSPLTVSRASRQFSIKGALGRLPPLPSRPTKCEGTRLVLHFTTRSKKGRPKQGVASKRKAAPTIEALRGSDVPGVNTTIQCVLARSEPIERSNTTAAAHL